MRLAVISDIHSNLHALQAVLDDINRRKVEQIVCAGDLVGYGAYPNQVIELLREREVPCVLGNYDDGVANYRISCGCDYPDEKAQRLGEASLLWTKEHTAPANKDFLRQLPMEWHAEIGGERLLVVHGSPRRLNEYLFQDLSLEVWQEVLFGLETEVLVCGHTHLPYIRRFGSKIVINAGSVGKPKHGDPAAVYALLSWEPVFQVDFIKVAYDHEAAAQAIEKSGLPVEFAEKVRLGIG
ncbi:MAG: metallophosphoesterase family protein [Bacillota bacterium]